jgi:hypothetical protein
MGKRVGAMPAEVNSVAFNSEKERRKKKNTKKIKGIKEN